MARGPPWLCLPVASAAVGLSVSTEWLGENATARLPICRVQQSSQHFEPVCTRSERFTASTHVRLVRVRQVHVSRATPLYNQERIPRGSCPSAQRCEGEECAPLQPGQGHSMTAYWNTRAPCLTRGRLITRVLCSWCGCPCKWLTSQYWTVESTIHIVGSAIHFPYTVRYLFSSPFMFPVCH